MIQLDEKDCDKIAELYKIDTGHVNFLGNVKTELISILRQINKVLEEKI